MGSQRPGPRSCVPTATSAGARATATTHPRGPCLGYSTCCLAAASRRGRPDELRRASATAPTQRRDCSRLAGHGRVQDRRDRRPVIALHPAVLATAAPLTYFQAVVLGVLQGVTELFPVSSLGHTVLFPTLFGWSGLVSAQSKSESFWLAFVVM